jgi:hypothetical protein
MWRVVNSSTGVSLLLTKALYNNRMDEITYTSVSFGTAGRPALIGTCYILEPRRNGPPPLSGLRRSLGLGLRTEVHNFRRIFVANYQTAERYLGIAPILPSIAATARDGIPWPP